MWKEPSTAKKAEIFCSNWGSLCSCFMKEWNSLRYLGFLSVMKPLLIISKQVSLQYHIPHQICQYFENYYRNEDGVVLTGKWRSERFKFKRGVFQGDPLIPTLFLMNFNPILQLLKNMEKQGCLITLPYADDFCVMKTDKRKQHKYTNLVNDKITSMRMKLKPSK